MRLGQTWEVPAWEIAQLGGFQLGSYRLGKRVWECTLTLHTVQSIQYKVHGTQYTIQEHITYTIQSSQNKYTVQVHSQVRS